MILQTEEIQLIDDSVEKISGVVQNNSATAQQSAAASEELPDHAAHFVGAEGKPSAHHGLHGGKCAQLSGRLATECGERLKRTDAKAPPVCGKPIAKPFPAYESPAHWSGSKKRRSSGENLSFSVFADRLSAQ